MTPIHFGKKLRYLVASEFESKLLGSKVYTREAGGWSEKAKKSGVFFDLSRVEWIELGVVVQLVLLIENALKKDIGITVALPLPKARRSENEWMQANPHHSLPVQNRIKYRKAVLDFLTHLRFQQALKPNHLGRKLSNLFILDDYDPSISKKLEEHGSNYIQEEKDKRGANELQEPERLYQYCFPLCWISQQENPSQIHQLAKFLARVASSNDGNRRGIEIIDADTIANVILYELVENVAKHAGKNTSWALVTARLRPENTPPLPGNYLGSVQPYIQWLIQKRSSIVEIIIGDSGKGIKNTLEKSFSKTALAKGINFTNSSEKTVSILRWAFDRWSTSKEDHRSLRGTRGLYRVDRIVKKYQGLVTLRSENQLVGIDHGGPSYDEPIPPLTNRPQKLSYVPGTMLSLWLPPFHERIVPRKLQTEVTTEVDIGILSLGAITKEGIKPDIKEKLIQSLNKDNILVLATICGDTEHRKEAIEETLRQAVELRHPGALVLLGLPGSHDEIETSIASVNAEHEKDRRYFEAYRSEHFEIWDPVLVIAPKENYYWVGLTATRRKVLDNLIANGGLLRAKEFRQLIPVEKERIRVLLEFRNDPGVVKILDDESLELMPPFAHVLSVSHVCRYVQGALERHIENDGNGVRHANKIYRAPSLHLMQKWLNVEKILHKVTDGPELAIFTLAERIKENNAWAKSGPSTFIIYDSASKLEHINLLQRWLNIEPKNKEVTAGEKGAHVYYKRSLIDNDARVIIYTDQIISNKSAVRCLQQILRDNAKPVLVACLFDLRKEGKKDVEIWGMAIPVVSLVRMPLIISNAVSCIPDEKIININPITREEEKVPIFSREKDNYKIKNNNLKILFEKHNALHFSHIGRPIGRHFTFYIGSSRLIEEEEIYTAFHSEIEEWFSGITDNQSRQPIMEIWYPTSEPQPFGPAKYFADRIHAERKDVVRIRPIPREPVYRRWIFSEGQTDSLESENVLIVDWGALTGETVMQLIRLAAEADAKRVLVCIFLSQLPKTEEDFLYSLHSLQIPPRHKKSQLLLWAESQDTAPPETQVASSIVKISVRFLGRFPIKAYQGENECPVCQGLPEMDQSNYPTELLLDFAKYTRRLLRTRTRGEIIENSSTGNESFLTSSSAINMAFFREDLMSALIFTNKRYEIFKRLDRFQKSIINNHDETPDEVLSFLTFLFLEPQWLRNPPLYFKKSRKIIADICLNVAFNTNVQEKKRLAAIVVLRASSKQAFVDNFYTLFESTINSSQNLMNCLLYSAFTYIIRPYHKSVKMFRPILEGLKKVKLNFGEKGLLTGYAIDTIDVLIARANLECSKAGVSSYSPSESWLQLRNLFDQQDYKKHDSIPWLIMMMKPTGWESAYIENKIKERNNEDGSCQLDKDIISWIKNVKRYWNTCCYFLDNSILPLLINLKTILAREIGRNFIGDEDVKRLVWLIDEVKINKKPLSESDFSILVNNIDKDPHLLFSKENWDKYIDNVYWFDNILLRNEKSNGKKSRLLDFLSTTPTFLGKIIKEEYESFKDKLPANHKVEGLGEIVSDDPLVFFPEHWAHEAIYELLDNVLQRTNPADTSISILMNIEKHDKYIVFIMSNNFTKIIKGDEKGLDTLKKRLQIFGGDLVFTEVPRLADSLTKFKVSLTFNAG